MREEPLVAFMVYACFMFVLSPKLNPFPGFRFRYLQSPGL
jgi:hypothetical protein